MNSIESIKLKLSLSDFESSTGFKACMGQRGLNPREIALKVRESSEGQPEDGVINLLVRLTPEGPEVRNLGLTMSYMIRSVVGDKSVVTDTDIKEIVERYADQLILKPNLYKEGRASMERLVRSSVRSFNNLVLEALD